MRGRSIRLTILIVVILALSLVSLAFSEINIDLPGLPAFQRDGNGPLGLKLGLDLRGGAHLKYQADVGTRIKATFAAPVDETAVQETIESAGIESSDWRLSAPDSLEIKTALLDGATRDALRAALEESFGVAETFRVTDTTPPSADDMEGVISIISRRVNLFGTEEPIVQQLGEDRVIVQLPGASGSVTEVEFDEPADYEDVERLLRDRGYQDFNLTRRGDLGYRVNMPVSLSRDEQRELERELNDSIGSVKSFGVTGGIEAAKALIGETARLEFRERTCTTPDCFEFQDADLGLTGDDLAEAFASVDQTTGQWAVNIQFNGRGADIFGELTQRIVGDPLKRIAIFLDDELLIAPVSRAWIRDGRSQITGNFTREEARTLSIQLESGRLPVPLELIQERQVDALLGSESLEKSLLAGMIGLGLVMVFMVAYYRMAGVVAALALVFLLHCGVGGVQADSGDADPAPHRRVSSCP